MSAIWRKDSEEWRPLLASGFPSEEALHDLVEDAPHLLPLSGDPTLVVVGREVALGTGYADLVAVESEGRVVIIEIKLRKNAEARRAVVAQVLTYAAHLRGVSPGSLEGEILRPHLDQKPFGSLVEGVRETDQTGEFDDRAFNEGLSASLADGAFRLVLVLDEAPAELVRLVGYLESISAGVVVDLISVSAYEVGDEQILVPQRVDPEHDAVPAARTEGPVRRAAKPKPVDGTEPFEQAIDHTDPATQASLRHLLSWARGLEDRKLATLRTVLGEGRQNLLVWLPGEKAGLVTIWNDGGAYISLWRSVFVRHAWEQIERIEGITGKPIGQGTSVSDPPEDVLDLLSDAYETAAQNSPVWDNRTYYVAFGEGPHRNWDDAREYGFISAGGGATWSKPLKQLEPGNRVFAYISKGSGVGGYVGVGEVTGPAVLAEAFIVEADGRRLPLTEVATADMTRGGTTDPDLAEWVVPIAWTKALPREGAIKDSDFFANQNIVARFTHGYTLSRLVDAFDLDDSATADMN